MGEIACYEEIKAFVAEHNIKQQQIALLAGKCNFCILHSHIWFIFAVFSI